MTESSRVVLPFLGTRTYLHGTTLFRFLIQDIPTDAIVSLRIKRVIRSSCIRIYRESEASQPMEISARLDWRSGDREDSLLVEEVPTTKPPERQSYKESLVVDKTNIEGRLAGFKGPPPFDLIATAIPIFKVLLNANNFTRCGGQWMLTRVDANLTNSEFVFTQLRLEQARAGLVAKSTILLDGEYYGDLYFSWVSG